MIPIYKKEMRTYFTHVSGYIFLTLFLLLVALFFVTTNVFTRNPAFHMTISQSTLLLFIMIPTLTMRLFSEEAKNKTDQLLYTSPITILNIVAGKFFAAFSLFFIAISATVLFPLLINRYGSLPVTQIIGTYIGFILLGACCIAVGVFISALTDNQIVAAVGAFAANFLLFVMETIALIMPTTTFASLLFVALIIVGVAGILYYSTKSILVSAIAGSIGVIIAIGLYFYNNLIYDGVIVRVLFWISLFSRFHTFSFGVLNLSDVIFYISFCALFIFMTINILEKRRWR